MLAKFLSTIKNALSQSPASIIFFMALGACSPTRNASTPSAGSAAWADAAITLSPVEEPYQLLLQFFPGVEGPDSRSRFSLFAAKASEGPEGLRKQVFYADWATPAKTSTQTYTYKLEVETTGQQLNLYFALLTPGISQTKSLIGGQTSDLKRIYIGSGILKGNLALISPSSALPFTFAYAHGAPGFVGNDEIVVHYIDHPIYEARPAQCSEDGGQACLTLLPNIVCDNGVAKTEGCRPPPPPAQESQNFSKHGEVLNAEPVESGIFLLKTTGNTQVSAEIMFVASAIASSDLDNQAHCTELVTVLKATAHDGRDNPACTIHAAPSPTAKDGKMACRYDITFNQPGDIAEYGCNVTAIVRGESPDIQTVQVLYHSETQND